MSGIPAFAQIASELKAVEAQLQSFYQLTEGKTRLLLARVFKGGKRIRPGLLILSAKLFKGVNLKVIHLAALVEGIHMASLMHDDVVDGADFRRGEKSFHLEWHNKFSVILADLLLSRIFMELCKSPEYQRYLKITTETTFKMARGQLKEMLHQGDVGLSPADYFSIIKEKTAELFAACCEMGALCGGASEAQIRKLRAFGPNLGVAFQLQDDFLDFWGEEKKLGKPVGSDLKEGKITLPVILLLEKAGLKEKDFIIKKIQAGKISAPDYQRILNLMEKYQCNLECRKKIAEFCQKSSRQLKAFPLKNSALGELLKLAEYVGERES